jgi:hypothetical protein
MGMQRLVVIGSDLVVGTANGSVWEFRELDSARDLVDADEPCVIGVVPVLSGMLTASDKTLDSVLASQFPPAHTIRTERLGETQFQGFAIEDVLLDQLKNLGREILVVPYGLAVRHVVVGEPQQPTRTHRLTAVFRRKGAQTTDPTIEAAVNETIVIDTLEGEFLLTAMRGQEVLAVRRVRGGNPVIELQRTAAASRMAAPRVLCANPDLLSDLATRGFRTEPLRLAGPLAGWAGLEATQHLRFLTPQELAREHAQQHRNRALGTLSAAVAMLVLAAGVWFYTLTGRVGAESARDAVMEQRNQLTAKLATLYPDRYPAIARQTSVQIHNELFDLGLLLPPQVELISLEKGEGHISAVVERRAGAAPFGRADLEAALFGSPYFGKASIAEEFQGTTIRYRVGIGVRPPPPNPGG